jgi:hypothetical protein
MAVGGGDGLLQQPLAVERERAQRLARGCGVRRGGRLDHKLGHQLGQVGVEVAQTLLLLPIAQALNADLGGPVFALAHRAAVVDQVGQGATLLLEHASQLLVQAADGDGVAGALELALDALRQPVGLLGLLAQCAHLRGRLGERLGQGRVALGEAQHQGVLALGLAADALRLGTDPLRLLLAPDRRAAHRAA